VKVANFGVVAPPNAVGVIIPPIIIGEPIPPGIPPGGPPIGRFLAERRLGGGAIMDDIASLGLVSSFGSSSFVRIVGGGASGLLTSAGSSPGNIHPVR
jgi:hypothetical protein